MTYRPRDYWTRRASAAGENYVGPGNRADRTAEQKEEFEKALSWPILSRRSSQLLDFGCGSGRFSSFLASSSKAYLGVDISPVGIEQARERNPKLDFLYLPHDRIPLADGVVDTVVAITVFQHIVAATDFDLWTSEVRRVLAPKGRVYLIEQKVYEDREPDEHVLPRTPDKFEAALGLKLLKLENLPEHWIGVFE